MLKKIKTEEFEEAVVTSPLDFRPDAELVRQMNIFEVAPNEVLPVAPAARVTAPPSRKNPRER